MMVGLHTSQIYLFSAKGWFNFNLTICTEISSRLSFLKTHHRQCSSNSCITCLWLCRNSLSFKSFSFCNADSVGGSSLGTRLKSLSTDSFLKLLEEIFKIVQVMCAWQFLLLLHLQFYKLIQNKHVKFFKDILSIWVNLSPLFKLNRE